MKKTVFADAINEATMEEMRRDSTVLIMGEDIRGAVYGATGGLLKEFGPERVLNTPLSEAGFMGAAVGAAAVGMRPIVETMACFTYVGMDQLISQAAKMRYMFGGQVQLPIVYRTLMFYGGGLAAHHSDRNYPIFMNIPGFKVVAPSEAADAKGMLKTAIRDNDPVMFFEDRTVLASQGPVPEDEDFLVPFGVADVKREGTDVTVVAIAGSVPIALAAADELDQQGVSAEVIDPRSLVPLDKQTILDSVAKTGRLVIADPAHRTCSAAAEISSILAEEGFWNLQAPIVQVTAHNVHIPFSPALEPLCYPTKEKIVDAVLVTLG